MPFPPSFLDELVARNPIEDVVAQYVNLRRSGANLFGLCPFHGEKTPSFSVSPEKGIYYCFGCHKGGGVVNFMMEIEGLSYPDAVRALAKRAGMTVPEDEQYQSRYRRQERLWALNKEAARFYHEQLFAPAGRAGLEYAQKRRLTKASLTRFGLGYAPDAWSALTDAMRAKGYTMQELMDAGLVSEKNGHTYDRFRNRFLFPIIDVRGNVVGFSGRVLDDSKPKYLNTPETLIFSKRRTLFGLNLAKKTKLGYLILLEGNVDVVTLNQFGFDCAVASLGTSLTEEHASLLSRYTEQVVLIYDADEAGQNATRRAIPILERAGLRVRVLRMRDAKDPDEFLNKFGPDRFKLLMEEASDRVEYQLDAIRRKYDLREDAQRVRFLQEAAALLSTLPSAVQREVYGSRVAEAAGVTAEAVKLEADKAYRRRRAREKKEKEREDLAPVRTLQPKTRSVRYDNMKSAMAEETVLALTLREPALLDDTAALKGADFSVPLLGRVYDQMVRRHRQGLEVSLAVLEDLEGEEMSHIAGIVQRQQGPVNQDALRDCVGTILAQRQAAQVSTEDDLLALRDSLKKSKGVGQ